MKKAGPTIQAAWNAHTKLEMVKVKERLASRGIDFHPITPERMLNGGQVPVPWFFRSKHCRSHPNHHSRTISSPSANLFSFLPKRVMDKMKRNRPSKNHHCNSHREIATYLCSLSAGASPTPNFARGMWSPQGTSPTNNSALARGMRQQSHHTHEI